MRTNTINQKITLAGLTTLVKAAVVGLLIGEAWYFSQAISNSLNRYLDSSESYLTTLVLCGVLSILTIVYLYIRNGHHALFRILRSYRVDVLMMFLLGLYISISFQGIGFEKYSIFLSSVNQGQLIPLVSFPLLIGLLLVFRALVINAHKPSKEAPFFISDTEKRHTREDVLDFSEDAARFAERVVSGSSTDSIVFGIDAPWGIGKSTFVNFCIEYWEEKREDRVIVYKFDLLRYSDRENLLEKFVDGLVRTIQKHLFIPEIRSLVSRYSRFIQPKGNFSRFGLSVDNLPGTYTVDDAFEDLESALTHFDKKVIVIIDDLDRLSFSEIKDVLFTIKKGFTLPNISYVLCYDTENIVTQEGEKKDDAEKVREFLEKFVNVKISIFLHAGTLSKYISENFEKAVQGNLQMDPFTLEKLKQSISAIKEIYGSADFYNYQPFLGDIRKLKRLLNTLVLFEIEKTDFENSDINKQDLIHLLLIYVNYPNIFRKIYNAETDGKRGFFSLVTNYDSGYPEEDGGRARASSSERQYRNSTMYTEYLGSLSSNQKFLLTKIFDFSRLESSQTSSISEEILNSYACFNGSKFGGGGRTLESYLNLIVKLSKPQKREQYRFYLNAKNQLVSGTPVEKILSDEEFSYSQGEGSREQFWRVVINSAREFSGEIGGRLITHLLDHIPEYSIFGHDKIGLGGRDDLAYFLVKLLDEAGWTDSRGGHRDNTEENVVEIAKRIFGEGAYEGSGVLEKLGALDRGPLGLYDLMIFRLYCSADRGGNFFNLQRALSKHGDLTAPTSGLVSEIVVWEMREISQRVFNIFKDQYITPNRNLFEAIDRLTLEEMAGKYLTFVQSKVTAGELTEEDIANSVATLKTRMKAFISYQLGNGFVNSGVGCGYYDEEGKDNKKGISVKMNEYLFDQCFNASGGRKNYECFLDYLLINLATTFGDERGRVPNIQEFTKVLDKKRLARYWKANAAAIRALNLNEINKEVATGNYLATYRADLNGIFTVLDEHVTAIEAEAASSV